MVSVHLKQLAVMVGLGANPAILPHGIVTDGIMERTATRLAACLYQFNPVNFNLRHRIHTDGLLVTGIFTHKAAGAIVGLNPVGQRQPVFRLFQLQRLMWAKLHAGIAAIAACRFHGRHKREDCLM